MQFYAGKIVQQQAEEMGFDIFSPIQSTKKMISNTMTVVIDKVVYVMKWVAGIWVAYLASKFAVKKFQEHQANEATKQQFAAIELQVQGA